MKQVVTVWADTSASYDDSPRSWDNLGTMVCAHRSCDLPQESGYTTDSAGYEELMASLSSSKRCGCIVLPVYMYDHSGTALSTTPFSCRWDSGQVGYIYVDYTDIRKVYPEW
jgi:hypothetical protein